MKPVELFLLNLNDRDIKLWAEGDRLRCSAPVGVLTPDVKAQLTAYKADILTFLTHQSDSQVTQVSLDQEAILDPEIYPCSTRPPDFGHEPSRILLTGATGFLGAFLLHELLQKTQADIYCLVRAKDADAGWQKIRRHLEEYLLWKNQSSSRIIPLVGDLSQPLLGLTESEFEAIAHSIDVIYHNGAWVNLAYPYSALKAVNVLGTQEVLRLAVRHTLKPLHFISTISVIDVVPEEDDQVIKETDPIENWQGLYNGYAQSKWVAETLVSLANARGIPVSIYRPGAITGHRQTGVSNTKDFLSTLLKGFIQLKTVPDLDALWMLAPVDYVSQAVVHLSRQRASLGKTFHLINPHPLPMKTFVDWVRSSGYTLEQVPYAQWRTDLLDLIHRDQNSALSTLLPLFPEQFSERQQQQLKLRFDCQNTLDGLAGTSIQCQPTTAELIDTYLSYFIQHDFFNPPRPQ